MCEFCFGNDRTDSGFNLFDPEAAIARAIAASQQHKAGKRARKKQAQKGDDDDAEADEDDDGT
jgi:hypothetical protein